LDFDLSSTIADEVWASLAEQAALPTNFQDYRHRRRSREVAETRRQYHRISCRGRALLTRGATLFGIYLIDESPAGVGFYSPLLMFPLENCQIANDQHEAISVEIRRSMRVAERCYSCGAVFREGPMSPTKYNEMLRSLRH
jgi:hypothetical protein